MLAEEGLIGGASRVSSTKTSRQPHAAPFALLAVAVTVGVHLAFGRRTILSVGIGTAVYVVFANAF